MYGMSNEHDGENSEFQLRSFLTHRSTIFRRWCLKDDSPILALNLANGRFDFFSKATWNRNIFE